MIAITKGAYEKNGVEVIVDNNGTLWLNKKYIEELYYINLPVDTRKYCSDHRRHRF